MPYLTEAQRAEWKPLIESENFAPIASNHRKYVTEVMLENQRAFLNEAAANTTANVDNTDPIIMALVRRTMPNLLAYDVAGVQPMTGPTGLIFCMRAHYGTVDQGNGPYGRPGDARSGFETGSALDSNGLTKAQKNAKLGAATDEALYREADTTFSGTGTQTSNSAYPNYDTYSVGTGLPLSAGEALGTSGGGTFNEMSITIEKQSVVAQTRALKASYTTELSQDLRQVHGLDAETELSNILSAELLAEQNRELINTIRKCAKVSAPAARYKNGAIQTDSAGNVVYNPAGVFDLDVNSDGRWSAEKYKSLLTFINKQANAIAKDTRRGKGNFIICSSDVASILDLTGKLVYAPALSTDLTVDDTGNTFVGILSGTYKVFIDPYLGYDEIIVGYKGPTAYDAGIYYAPYVPLQMTKVVDPSSFQPSIAYKTRYGICANPFTSAAINSNAYFRKAKIYNVQ